MKLRTYAESVEELGGVPWRKFDATERWFIPTPDTDGEPSEARRGSCPEAVPRGLPVVEEPSAAIIIGRPSMFAAFRNVPRTTWWIVIAAVGLLGFAAALLG